MDNQWPNIFGPISNPLAFKVFYPVQYYISFIYFISHTIKNWLKNAATLPLSSHPPGSFCLPPSNVIAALGICFCRSEKDCPAHLLGSHPPRFRYITYSYPETPHTTPCAALPPGNMLYFTINTVVLDIL